MATTTTPNVETTPKLPVNLTPTAVVKVKEIMGQQNPVPAGLRIGVVGGGCSGFSYSMSFENAPGVMDKVYTFDELKVYVDATSAMYLNGCIVDFVETLEASGFKFENPNVKSTCGCGSSFIVYLSPLPKRNLRLTPSSPRRSISSSRTRRTAGSWTP